MSTYALKKAISAASASSSNAMVTDEPLLPDFLLMLKYVLDKCALRVKSSKHRVDIAGIFAVSTFPQHFPLISTFIK